MKFKTVNITEGNLLSSIIVYTIPVIFIGLVQSLFNAVDIMVLGYVADTQAVASVGATSSIIHLLINTFFGISSGAKIVLARLMGAHDEEKTQQAISTSLITAILLGTASALLGIFSSNLFLTWTQCPSDCFDGALLYMRIYLASAPIIMLYNFGTAVLSVSGDSQRPLYYMLFSGGLNVVLNFILCYTMTQKVAAVAIATVVSQAVGAFLVLRRLLRNDGICQLRLNRLKWSFSSFKNILGNGIPIALSTALYPLANLQIQTQTNSFGSAVIAGNSASTSLETIAGTIAASPWGSAATVFVGQNLGAKKPDRVKKSILYTLAISLSLGVLAGGTVLFSRGLLSLYVSEEAAILAGQTRLKYTLLPYVIACANNVLSHTIQSFGYSLFCTVNSIVSVLGFRMVWMKWIYPTNPTFDMLCRCYLVSWLLIVSVYVLFFLYIYHSKLKRGKIKSSV